MYVRIAKFEGDPDRVGEAIDAARKQAEANWDSPPEGLESAKELWMLLDRETQQASESRCSKPRKTCAEPMRR